MTSVSCFAIQVKFTSDMGSVSEEDTEDGLDQGGPSRELFRITLQHWTSMRCTILEGTLYFVVTVTVCQLYACPLINSRFFSDQKPHVIWINFVGNVSSGFSLKANLAELERGSYRHLGQFVATMIIQGGQPPAIFTPTLVDALLDEQEGDHMDDVINENRKDEIQKVHVGLFNMFNKIWKAVDLILIFSVLSASTSILSGDGPTGINQACFTAFNEHEESYRLEPSNFIPLMAR